MKKRIASGIVKISEKSSGKLLFLCVKNRSQTDRCVFVCERLVLVASVLFGIWHVAAPIRSFLDGVIGFEALIANAIMLLVTTFLIGFKFAMLTGLTGSIYMAMGDHFLNNTIVNILHVITKTGADKLMLIRIATAQSASFIIVLRFYVSAIRTGMVETRKGKSAEGDKY